MCVVMLFILDNLKKKDLGKEGRDRERILPSHSHWFLFFLPSSLSDNEGAEAGAVTQCYKNQPTRDLLEYLSGFFVCVSLHDADAILSTGGGRHGDQLEGRR